MERRHHDADGKLIYVETIETGDPVPQPGTREEIIAAIPAQGYADFKASTGIVAVKNWGLWHARPIFTPAQWDEVADFMETSGFITTAEAETMKSAKPVS